jgi:hypothetical protein
MTSPFDIFQMIPVDRVLWKGTAGSMEEAQSRVQELGAGSPGKYLILCVQTGTGLVVNTDGAGLATTTEHAKIAQC